MVNIFKLFFRKLYTIYWKHRFTSFGPNSYMNPFAYLIYGSEYIKIGNNVVIGGGIQLTAWEKHNSHSFTPSISIGDGTNIGSYNHITAIDCIEIGNNVLTGKNVLITDNSHGEITLEDLNIPPSHRPPYSKGKVVIEDNVWIGDKATILPNVRIGRSAIIGANSVVTKDVPPFSVACGNPAKIIKKL